jgi:hypothetical protein
LESHSVLGTIWVSFGLLSYYLALIWINTLLGMFLTPLFLIPMTWLQDVMVGRKRRARAGAAPVGTARG